MGRGGAGWGSDLPLTSTFVMINTEYSVLYLVLLFSIKVSEVLREGRLPRGARDNPLVRAVYSGLVGGNPGEHRARELLHTSFHNVPKLELSNPHMSPW